MGGEAGQTGMLSALWVMEDSDEKMTSHCHLLVLDDTLASLLVLDDAEGRQSSQPN